MKTRRIRKIQIRRRKQKGGNETIIWITLINKGYIDFTKNFIESMRQNNIRLKLIVYCLDKDTIDALINYKEIQCISADVFIKFKATRDLSVWSTDNYKRIVFAKLDAIKYTLSQYKNSYIGYIDTDIILLKDPNKIILETFNANPNTEFISQCDESRNRCSNINKCPSICSGVIVFKHTPHVNKLFEYTENDIKGLASDQSFINKIAGELNINHISIEKNVFLNGSFPGVIHKGNTLDIPKEAVLIHYNYLVGEDKIKHMKKNNMWYIKENTIVP